MAVLLAQAPAHGAPAASRDVAIVGATVIDVRGAGRSTNDLTDATVVIRNGIVRRIGKRGRVAIPRGIHVVAAGGQYLIPGLIDGFGSLRTQGFADAYLYEGVTSVYINHAPAGGDGEPAVKTFPGGPRIFQGATIGGYALDGATPETHPWTEYRRTGRRLTAAQLTQDIARRASNGARGLLIGIDAWPDQVGAIARAATAHGLTSTGEFAFTTYPEAIASGVRVLVRSDHYLTALADANTLRAYAEDPNGLPARAAYRAVCELTPDSEPVARLAKALGHAGTALMPILTIEATADDVGAPNPWHSRAAMFVTASDLDNPVDAATDERPFLKANAGRRAALQACALRRQAVSGALSRQGVTYLAGSGAPSYGIMPGAGLHQELRLMQRIGLPPRAALAAATGNFAVLSGWSDVGRIEVGRVGDAVLLGSDPRVDVAALDDIRTVIADGRVVDRASLAARAEYPR